MMSQQQIFPTASGSGSVLSAEVAFSHVWQTKKDVFYYSKRSGFGEGISTQLSHITDFAVEV